MRTSCNTSSRSASTRPRRAPTLRTIVRKRVITASIVDETRSIPGPAMSRTYCCSAAAGNSSSRTSLRCVPVVVIMPISRGRPSGFAMVVPRCPSRPWLAPRPSRVGEFDVRDRVQLDLDAALPHDAGRVENAGQPHVAGRSPSVAEYDHVLARAAGWVRRQRVARNRLAARTNRRLSRDECDSPTRMVLSSASSIPPTEMASAYRRVRRAGSLLYGAVAQIEIPRAPSTLRGQRQRQRRAE